MSWFLPRDAVLCYASEVYAVVMCVCLCVSVTLWYCRPIKMAKHIGSRKECHTGRGDSLMFSPHKISSQRLKLETSNFKHWLVMWLCSIVITNCPLCGHGHGHVALLNLSLVLFSFWGQSPQTPIKALPPDPSGDGSSQTPLCHFCKS